MSIIQPTLISPFIEAQLPDFYLEDGPAFVAFIKAYYEWLEQQSKILGKTRRIKQYRDIDTVDIEKLTDIYIPNFPTNLAVDQRHFIKHVVDLYRSKGTEEAFRILFKALYNKNVTIYSPGKDILTVSGGNWKQPIYLEVASWPGYETDFAAYVGKRITGLASGARATVEEYNVKYVSSKVIHILSLSNISGYFEYGERFDLNTATAFDESPRVLGSLTAISIVSGGVDYDVGDLCTIIGNGGNGLARVASVRRLNGIIDFDLVDGGSGYTMNAVVSIAGGDGTGATFRIGGLTNISEIRLNTDTIAPYANVELDAVDYGFPAPGGPFTLTTIIDEALTWQDWTIGSIDYLTAINPGNNYSVAPTVSITEPMIAALGLQNGKGGISGEDAVVTATARTGDGVLTSVTIVDSGYGYEPGEYVTIQSLDDPNRPLSYGYAIVTQQGKSVGFWLDDQGKLSADKFIQDGHYYQCYSYEIRSDLDPSIYDKVVQDVVHPTGIARFNKFSFVDETNVDATLGVADSDVIVEDRLIIRADSTLYTADLADTTDLSADYSDDPIITSLL